MVKYFWSESNGVDRPTIKYMGIGESADYYVGMPLKKVDEYTVAPTDGDPEFICMREYSSLSDAVVLDIAVMEVFPDAIYEKWNEDGSVEEVRFGSGGGGGGDLLETVETEVPLVITFDGDLTGKETVLMPDGNTIFVKVYNEVLTPEQIVGSTIIADSSGNEIKIDVTSDMVFDGSADGMNAYVIGDGEIMSVYGDFPAELGISMSAGVWFTFAEGVYLVKSLTCPNASTTVTKQQIKTELLPDALQFGEKKTAKPLNITWDGDLTGKETTEFNGFTIVKVSDIILTVDQLDGGTIYVAGDGVVNEIPLNENNVIDGANLGMPGIIAVGELVMVVNGDTSALGLSLSTGVWIIYTGDENYVEAIANPNVTITTSEITKIDNKFIDAEWMAKGGQEQFEGEILPETTFSVDKLYGDKRWTSDEVLSKCGQLKEGNTVRIVLNDTVFDYAVKYAFVPLGNSGLEYLYVGNLGAVLSDDGLNSVADTGEPFCINFGGSNFTTGEFEANCLISIVSEEYVGVDNIISISAVSSIVPLPEKFIPDLTELTLISPSGKKFSVTVDDTGALTATEV